MMMHYSIWRAYQHTFLSDNGYRCQRCGKGPVVASDGFLMTHCLTCDSGYQSATPIDLGISRIGQTVQSWFKSLGQYLNGLFRNTTPELKASNEQTAETGVL